MHRHSPWETQARRLDASDGGAINILEFEMVAASSLRDGDLILCTIGDVIPATGEVIEGVATLGEAKITESVSSMRRVSVTDGSAVVPGMKVLSGWIVVRASAGRHPEIEPP